ncbi:ABC transporter ATP-binding protein [Parvularcula lutaonensis]|uniref:ABC transporter ATP-binding protein n=1 Tax=Parvularcula lutaonensis TaxID=491923 RepID=A0ABV7MGD8_9PROT|nr:ABC transporter ATP-binding protein [Parvularcula lutaonensis]GGY55667.1 multidrug ABC transporter ATP-binding protein [Parvularcula lutaonensis]
MLKISGLTKTYPNGVKALDGVDLDIGLGMFGLLGPNGAGKSSLMRTIATLQGADRGSVQFGDIDVLKDPDPVRRQLGYLPQDFGVYPRISAIKLLDHIAVLKGISNGKERKEVVHELLRQTNLWDVRKKAPSTYSGGMRQRFGIAQALLGDPKLIIVDEPTAGLDPEERNRFHNLLSEIGENVVVILSTHIVEDVADLCRDMAIMNQGRIAAKGQPSELVETVRGKIWRKVIEKADLEAHQKRHKVVSARLVQGQTVIRAYSVSDPGDGFEPVEPNLEDVYFATIRGAINNGQQAEAA